MARSAYVALMLAVTVGLPLVVVLMSLTARLIPARFINLPNREYWLAPERCAETVGYLARQGIFFGALLAVFLCFVHWLVVIANWQDPPHLPERLLFAGVVAFVVALVAWAGVFVLHFRRRP